MLPKCYYLYTWLVVASTVLGLVPIASADFGSLFIQWAAVIDNGEGAEGGSKWKPRNWGKHGPVGNLHVLVYEASWYSDLRRWPSRQSYPRALRHFVLRGPTQNEWDDGGISTYGHPGVELFRWRSNQDAVTVFIYESDPDRKATSRAHDPLFLEVVSRQSTISSEALSTEFLPANDDAIERAVQRNGLALQRWLRDAGAWTGAIRRGIPTMFMKLQTLMVPYAASTPPRVSEENSPAFCPLNHALVGLWCQGKVCDDKELICRRYIDRNDTNWRYRFGPAISEEPPRNTTLSYTEFASGLSCRGSYCDNVSLEFLHTPHLSHSGICYWTPLFSEENVSTANTCADTFLVAGLSCQGEYCDNLSLRCCRARELKVQEADGLCFEIRDVSEEEGGMALCPQGYAISGMECSGSYCDNKRLTCCAVGSAANPDRLTYVGFGPFFSEEGSAPFFETDEGFITGLKCRGEYCDDISLEIGRPRTVSNTGDCSYQNFFSEESPSSQHCTAGRFVAGLQCRGKYCDDIALRCCRARSVR